MTPDLSAKEQLVDAYFKMALKGIIGRVDRGQQAGNSNNEIRADSLQLFRQVLKSPSLVKSMKAGIPLAQETIRIREGRGFQVTPADLEAEIRYLLIELFEDVFAYVLVQGFPALYEEMLYEMTMVDVFAAKGCSRKDKQLSGGNSLAYLYASLQAYQGKSSAVDLLGEHASHSQKSRAVAFRKKLEALEAALKPLAAKLKPLAPPAPLVLLQNLVLKNLSPEEIINLELVVQSLGKGIQLEGSLEERLKAALLHLAGIIQKKHQEKQAENAATK